MANNFHDQAGLYIVGIDGHVGIHFPPLMVSTFFVSVTAVHPFVLGADKQPTVLMNGGRQSVLDQHNPKFLWPHIAFSPDPLDLFTPLHTIFGEQKCWLPRLAVHICGTPAAPTAITGPISVNTECWEFCMLPLSLVFQDGTVQTTPTAADYAYGVVRYLVETVIDLVIFAATGGFGDGPIAFSKAGLKPAYQALEKEVAEQLVEEGVEATTKNVTERIQKDVAQEFVSSLFFDVPTSKSDAARFTAETMKSGFMSDSGWPSTNWSWGEAGTSVFNSVIPISGPIGDAADLRAEQQQINQGAP